MFDDREPREGVYEIDLSEFGREGVLLYAPLADRVRLVRDGSPATDDWLADAEFRPPKTAERFEELTSISILPTHRCNFRCSYCYSALGRGAGTLSETAVENAVGFFISTRDLAKVRSVRMTVLGAGEPLLEKNLVRKAIDCGRSGARARGIGFSAELVTNGSLIDGETCAFLAERSVDTGVSFELLRDVQIGQRGEYEAVARGIAMLCAHGVRTVVQSTITPANVQRMSEMYETLRRLFPRVGTALFEPAVSDRLFPDEKSLSLFCDAYLESFFAVRERAARENIVVSCRSVASLSRRCVSSGCERRFCLTPDERITACFCTSSPQEARFADLAYGAVADGRVEIDTDKLGRLLSTGIGGHAECRHCFARWHCAGGCELANDIYRGERKLRLCRFTRALHARALLTRVLSS